MESQSEDKFNLNACSDDEIIIDRMLYEKTFELE